MSNLDEKIKKIIPLLGENSRFLDDAILIEDESGSGEKEVLLFRSKEYFVTVDKDHKFLYWKPTYIGGVLEDDYIRHYCGLPQEEPIFERDIFVAGLVEIAFKIILPQETVDSLAF